jgi:hypothetical protein
MLGAGAISVFCGGENAVVAACRGVRMIVSVTLNLIIVPVIVAFVLILMHVCLHDLMLIRATIVRSTIFRSILRADQRRGQRYHRESRQSEQFPRMLAHVLSSFRVWA